MVVSASYIGHEFGMVTSRGGGERGVVTPIAMNIIIYNNIYGYFSFIIIIIYM